MSNPRDEKSPSVLSGVGLSPGMGLGTAYLVQPRTPGLFPTHIGPEEVSSELERLDTALEQSRQQLDQIRRRFERELGKEHAYIIDAHLLILKDPALLDQIRTGVREDLQSPELAVQECSKNWQAVYRALSDPFFQERGSDVQEVLDRVLANLSSLGSQEMGNLPREIVLIVPQISLLLLAEYPLDQVRGLIVEHAGVASHPVIIARSCRIPVVSGIGESAGMIRTGDPVIVDGDSGEVTIRPSAAKVLEYQRRVERDERQRREDAEDDSPCVTSDGQRIRLYTNAELEEEVSLGIEAGAEGIGLFRSEYLFMKIKEGSPSEEDQLTLYRNLLKRSRGKPVTIRTLDLGGERHPYFSTLLGDSGSVLGLRGIRFSLKHPDIFREQIRAILRAGVEGDLRIVLPMVSDVSEVLRSREQIEAAREELRREGYSCDRQTKIGIMVEVPAAVVLLSRLCEHVDFLAVGTNDLTQYLLATGREDDQVADLFDPLHPAVLHSLDQVARVAHEAKCPAVVCGEIASHPLYGFLLVGMGFRQLSMNSVNIGRVKRRMREISSREAAACLQEVLSFATLEEVRTFLESYAGRIEVRP